MENVLTQEEVLLFAVSKKRFKVIPKWYPYLFMPVIIEPLGGCLIILN